MNGRLIKFILIGLLAVGCKGKNGKDGPQGTPGLNGPQEVTISGAVSSDDFIITDPRFKLASSISVYMNDGVKLTESPYYLPSVGLNTYYLADPVAGKVEIFNGVKALASGYIIVILI